LESSIKAPTAFTKITKTTTFTMTLSGSFVIVGEDALARARQPGSQGACRDGSQLCGTRPHRPERKLRAEGLTAES
jgi:hypothetical protein